MAKKYLGKNPLNTLMGIMLDVIPSKELSEDTDIQRMWDKLNIKPAPIGSESNWSYTLDDTNNTITLNQYTGAETNVIVYGRYIINGKEYDTKIGSGTRSNSGLFRGDVNTNCKNIKTITFNEGIDTSNITTMNSMFPYCSSLTTINGLEYFDTSNVTDMSRMFMYCSALTSLDVSSFNTAKVTDMSYMFEECSLLTELDLRSFNTYKVDKMPQMFYKCSSLTEIKVTTGLWKTPTVDYIGTGKYLMFRGCGVSAVTYYPAA